MKIVLNNDEQILSFISATDLIDILKRVSLESSVVRVELTSKEFQEMLYDVDLYDPIGVDSDSPEDYSGCYVLLDNRWCVQSHESYYE